MQNETGQYFDENPKVESKPETFTKEINGVSYEFKSDRGVFSKGSLDKASEILISKFFENYTKTPKSIVDVGCGYGPIICAVAEKFSDARLLGVDTNKRARDLCSFNYKKNIGDSRLQVLSPNEISTETRYDLIISNPPIRIGKKLLYELLELWAKRLTPDGEMWLVMAKHLGSDSCAVFLETSCGLKVERVASKKGFRILKAVK
jgi:16S rRNA (guanine1207-N2)-methyltransferase